MTFCDTWKLHEIAITGFTVLLGHIMHIPSHVFFMWSLQQSWDLDLKPHFAYEEAEVPWVRRLLREGEGHAEGAILSAHARIYSDWIKWIYQTSKEMRSGLQIKPDGKPKPPCSTVQGQQP